MCIVDKGAYNYLKGNNLIFYRLNIVIAILFIAIGALFIFVGYLRGV